LPHFRPHRVDPVAWQEPLLWQREVDRGKAERAAAFIAVHDPAADAVGPAQESRRGLHIASEQHIANTGGADDRAVDLDRRDDVDDESIAPAPFAELFNIALGAAAEGKVGTDGDAPDGARPLHSIHQL